MQRGLKARSWSGRLARDPGATSFRVAVTMSARVDTQSWTMPCTTNHAAPCFDVACERSHDSDAVLTEILSFCLYMSSESGISARFCGVEQEAASKSVLKGMSAGLGAVSMLKCLRVDVSELDKQCW